MASEIEAAAERYKANEYPTGRGLMDEVYEPITKSVDRVLLAQYAVDRLAADRADRAERKERARPIDASRLPIALRGHRELTACMRGGVELWHFAGDATSVVSIPECATQGALDDLLRVLKGGA